MDFDKQEIVKQAKKLSDEVTFKMTNYETILLDVRAKGTALLTLNRPDRLNAVTDRMLDELDDAVHELNADMSVRAVVITGPGGDSVRAETGMSSKTSVSRTG